MHKATGEILNDVSLENMKEAYEDLKSSEIAPMTSRQVRAAEKIVDPEKRKGYMRNQPCVCGSGKKYKKCCW